jgi:hypothetical protein
MVEHIEREALSEVSLEVRLEEVVSPLEEIPSMVKLDAPQLGELTKQRLSLRLGVRSRRTTCARPALYEGYLSASLSGG